MSEVQEIKTEEYSAFQLWFVRLFVLATALGCFYKGFEIYKSYKSADWPFVRGKIDRSWRSDHPTLPNIRYTYKVGAQTYQGNTVAYRDLVGVNETKRILKRFLTGKQVNVYTILKTIENQPWNLDTWREVDFGLLYHWRCF